MGSGDVVGLLSNASDNEVLLQNGGLLELQNVVGTDFFGSNNVVNAQTGDTINVAGNSNVIEMANGDEVGFFGSGTGNEVLLTNGSIWMVGSVTGSNFFGSGDIVTTNSFDSLSLYGSSNDVHAGDSNSINVTGSLNTASVGQNGYVGIISGSGDSVTMTGGVVDMLNGVTGFILTGSNDTVNAGTGGAGGSGDSINIVGSTDIMNMTNGGYVGIISGSDDSVNMTAGVVDMLNGVTGFTLSGTNNAINAGTGSSGGSGDFVSVEGNGNGIQMTNGGNVQIMSGSGNDQIHMSGGAIEVQSGVTGLGIFGSGDVVTGASSDTVEVIGNNSSLRFAAGSYVQLDVGDAGNQVTMSGGTIGVQSGVTGLGIFGSGDVVTGASSDTVEVIGNNSSLRFAAGSYVQLDVGDAGNQVTMSGGTIGVQSGVTGLGIFGSGDVVTGASSDTVEVIGSNNALSLAAGSYVQVDAGDTGTQINLSGGTIGAQNNVSNLMITGSSLQFIGGSNDSVFFSGNNNNLALGNGCNVEILSGGGNTANMTNGSIFVGSGVTGMIVNGAGNNIDAQGGSSTNINGNANRITAAAGSYVGIVGGTNVSVSINSGSVNTVNNIGSSTLTGSFNNIGVGSGNQITLNGNDNTVNAQAGDTIYISSADSGDTININNGNIVVQSGVSNIEINGINNSISGVNPSSVTYNPTDVSSIAAYFSANPNLTQTQIKAAESNPSFQSGLASYLTSVNIQAMPANTMAMLEGYSNVYLSILGIPASVIAQAAYIDQQFAWAETQAPIMTDGLQQALQNLVPALLDPNAISKSMMSLASGLIANAHDMSIPYNAQHPADTVSQDFTAAKLAIQIAQQPDNAKTGLSEMFQLSDMNVPLNLVVTPGAPPGIGPGLQFFAKAENGTWFHQFLGVIDSYVTPIVDIAAVIPGDPFQPLFQATAAVLELVQSGQQFAAGNDLGGALDALGAIAGGLTQTKNLVGQTLYTFGVDLSKTVAITQAADGVVIGAQDGQLATAIASALGGVTSGTEGVSSLSALNAAAAIGAALAATDTALTNGNVLAAISAISTAAADPTVGQEIGAAFALGDQQQPANTVIKINGIPTNSIGMMAPDGEVFYAPSDTNFYAVANAAALNGLNPLEIAQDLTQGGLFDFQRQGNYFIGAYTNASNFAVGVYMESAGYTKQGMDDIGQAYAAIKSSGNFQEQEKWWNMGWDAAQKGNFP